MRSMMEDLYFDDYTDWSGGRPHDPKYDEINRRISDIKIHFMSSLSSEDQALFEELEHLGSERSTLQGVHLYKCGTCFGTLLMLDMFEFLDKEGRL